MAGLAITMLGIISAAFQKQAGWKCIDAQCIDREIGECEKDPGVMTSTWVYRLVCVFNYEGKEYKVTPEPSHLTSFSSERQVQKYLDERIQPGGRCQLWINPKNPLQTIFHKNGGGCDAFKIATMPSITGWEGSPDVEIGMASGSLLCPT